MCATAYPTQPVFFDGIAYEDHAFMAECVVLAEEASMPLSEYVHAYICCAQELHSCGATVH